MFDDILGKEIPKKITPKSKDTDVCSFKEVWEANQRRIDNEYSDDEFAEEYEDLQLNGFMII